MLRRKFWLSRVRARCEGESCDTLASAANLRDPLRPAFAEEARIVLLSISAHGIG